MLAVLVVARPEDCRFSKPPVLRVMAPKESVEVPEERVTVTPPFKLVEVAVWAKEPPTRSKVPPCKLRTPANFAVLFVA